MVEPNDIEHFHRPPGAEIVGAERQNRLARKRGDEFLLKRVILLPFAGRHPGIGTHAQPLVAALAPALQTVVPTLDHAGRAEGATANGQAVARNQFDATGRLMTGEVGYGLLQRGAGSLHRRRFGEHPHTHFLGLQPGGEVARAGVDQIALGFIEEREAGSPRDGLEERDSASAQGVRHRHPRRLPNPQRDRLAFRIWVYHHISVKYPRRLKALATAARAR